MATKTKKKKSSTKPKKKSTAAKKTKAKKRASKKLNVKTVIAFTVSLILIVAVISSVVIVHNKKSTSESEIVKIIDKDKAWGVDVSSHNGKINWEKLSKKADFAFIRVGYRGYAKGEINADKQLKNNLKGAEKYSVPVGVYFYSQAVNEKEAVEEAKYVLEKISLYKVQLPIVIDFEYPTKNGKQIGRLKSAKLNDKKRTALINAFCDTVRDAGYTPGVYASSYIYKSYLHMNKIPSDVFIWVADYNNSVTYKGYYDIWQYSETGKCDGIKNKVDTNYWYIKNRL